MSNTRKTDLDISYNGKNITNDIKNNLKYFSYIDVASGECDTLSIVLAKHGWFSTWLPGEEDYIESTIFTKNWKEEGDNRKLKCGKFMIDDFYLQGPPSSYSLRGISSPIQTDFAHTTKNKTWSKTTTKGIALQIAKNAKVSLVYDAPSYSIAKIEQSGESDMSFLFKVCQDYNLSMKIYNYKLIIFDEAAYEKKSPVGTIDIKDCDSYTLNKTLIGKFNSVIIKYKVAKSNKTYTYEHKETKGGRILKVNNRASSLADAKLKAIAALRKANKEAQTAQLSVMGDVLYMAGTCLILTGFGKFNGKYYIDKVTHTITDGYTANLQMHKV